MKRGRRARTLVRLRRCAHRAQLPSLLLSNVQSLENKLSGLQPLVFFQPDIWRCNVLCFTETSLSAETPSHAIAPMGFSICADQDMALSQKKTGGGVCLMVNWAWCHEGNVSSPRCLHSTARKQGRRTQGTSWIDQQTGDGTVSRHCAGHRRGL